MFLLGILPTEGSLASEDVQSELSPYGTSPLVGSYEVIDARTGELPNGLRYVILPRKSSEPGIGIEMYVEGDSLRNADQVSADLSISSSTWLSMARRTYRRANSLR